MGALQRHRRLTLLVWDLAIACATLFLVSTLLAGITIRLVHEPLELERPPNLSSSAIEPPPRSQLPHLAQVLELGNGTGNASGATEASRKFVTMGAAFVVP